MIRYIFILLFVGLMFAATADAPAVGVTEAVLAHDAAVGRIDTVNFEFDFAIEDRKTSVPKMSKVTGQYWRAPGHYRLTYVQDGVLNSVVSSPERVVFTTDVTSPSSKKVTTVAMIYPNVGPVNGTVNPWRKALLAMDSPRGSGTQPFGEHYREWFGDGSYEEKNGVVVITNKSGSRHVVLDPKVNYLIRRKYARIDEAVRRNGPPDPLVTEIAVEAFQEPAPGIFFPKRVTEERRYGNDLNYKNIINYRNVVINKPPPAGVFEHRYTAAETTVEDFVRSIKYKVDASGRVIEPERELVKVAAPSPSLPGQFQSTQPTRAESRPAGWWLAPVGVVLLLAGAAIAARRRRSND